MSEVTSKQKYDDFFKRQREKKLNRQISAPTFQAISIKEIKQKADSKPKTRKTYKSPQPELTTSYPLE